MSDLAVTQADVTDAATRLTGVVRETPLLSHPALDAIAGRKLLVKAESLQRTGSFKFRGASNAVAQLPKGTSHVVAFSSGNHAQGVALAAQSHGLPATIIMPADAPVSKIQGTKGYGAQVATYDRAIDSREEAAQPFLKKSGAQLIHPFDNPHVIAGQGTAGTEIIAQAAAQGVQQADVLVCTGGGGLASGIALAVQGTGLRVRTVEPEGFDDAARSLAQGNRVTNAATTGSICDAILTPSPGTLTFPILQEHAGPGLVVSDTDALRAAALAFTYLRIVLEPGGAVALAAALFKGNEQNGDAVIAVATGGNVDAEMFAHILEHVPIPDAADGTSAW